MKAGNCRSKYYFLFKNNFTSYAFVWEITKYMSQQTNSFNSLKPLTVPMYPSFLPQNTNTKQKPLEYKAFHDFVYKAFVYRCTCSVVHSVQRHLLLMSTSLGGQAETKFTFQACSVGCDMLRAMHIFIISILLTQYKHAKNIDQTLFILFQMISFFHKLLF